MSSKTVVSPEQLGEAVAELLGTYNEQTTERVNEAGREAMKKLVKLTKASAPKGVRGTFKKNITSQELDSGHGLTKFVWGVKAPDHRLTHLIVHGHATPTGGRTKANPFLQQALDRVLPEYEELIEEALKND